MDIFRSAQRALDSIEKTVVNNASQALQIVDEFPSESAKASNRPAPSRLLSCADAWAGFGLEVRLHLL